MKYLYVCTLAAVALFASCSKDDNGGNPPPTPPDTLPKDSTTVSFPNSTMGLAELYESWKNGAPTFTVSKMKPNRAFHYSIVGKNGGPADLKKATDTLVEGHGIADANGNVAIVAKGMNHYKDGEISVVLHMEDPDTMITAKFRKAEYQIRDYRDFIHMGFYISSDTSAHYVQVNDFAFPDTVFNAAPGFAVLYGSYDGQGHKITNLTIQSAGTNSGSVVDVGLFRSGFTGSVIKNVRLELSDEGITCAKNGNVGGIVGQTAANSSILNCSVRGNITVPVTEGEATYAGGIVGVTNKTNIAGCSFRGDISGPVVGGIAGLLGEQSVVDISYAAGAFDGGYAGGIIGLWGGSGALHISNSYAYATTYPAIFDAIAPSLPGQIVLTNCFANGGTTQNGVTIVTLPSMNMVLSAMEITDWPQGITPPASNKPYKNDTDPAAPMKLWWE